MANFNDEKIESIISKMTLEEKSAIVAGVDNMYTNAIPRLGIPSMTVADGPHGLRKQIGTASDNVANSEPATAFPTAVTLASSWNKTNAYNMGKAIGEECRHYGVGVLLGPGINLKRNPLCGRNFEYYSEDTYLTSTMSAQTVKGVQSNDVGVSVKHFALNQSENYRFMSDSICDERTMREVYLKTFERVVKDSKPASLMCSYNKINGTHASENEWLLTKVLRDEWGYDGLVMSDWGAVKDRIKGIKAGLDLEMPGDTKYCRRKIIDSVKDGTLDVNDLDKCVGRVLKFVLCHHHEDTLVADFDAHCQLAEDIASDSAVLMKNDGVLPLDKKEKVLIVGELFESMRYQGAGSSQINPTKVVSPEDAFKNYRAEYLYSKGYNVSGEEDDTLIEECLLKSKEVDKIVAFIGLTDREESEGVDRESINLPKNQLQLIDKLVSTGKKIVVVLFGGSVVSLPFAKEVNAILNMFLPGQSGGSAVYKLLYGDKNPSGRLSESWIKDISDVPFYNEYSNSTIEVYREGIFVGYKYHLSADTSVAYPFGYGLSYTYFRYDNFDLKRTEEEVVVSFDLSNIGSRYGGEVVQLYVSMVNSKTYRPIRELKSYDKIYLNAGETKRVTLSVPLSDLSYYDVTNSKWAIEGGTYEFSICSDCTKVIHTLSLDVVGDVAECGEEIFKAYSTFPLAISDETYEKMSGLKIPDLLQSRPFTTESRIDEFKGSFFGKIIYKILMSVPKKKLKRAKKIKSPIERENAIKASIFIGRMISSSCLRAMSMSDKRLPYNLAEALVFIANGHLFKGIKKALSPIKVPPLPRDCK